jgi:hydrophobic/amphiphilic exporter-1 (mainly G- bacteria), HAE1 family
MRGNISAWAIRRPIPSIVLFIILTAVGIVSFASMSITDSPNVDLPLVSITVTQSGAAPEELETQVTRLVEDAVANLGRIKEITSTVTDGSSETDVEFTIGTNTDRAVNDVRDAISKIRSELPGTIDEPQVERVDASGDAVVAYAVSIPGYSPARLGWFVDNDVARAMSTVKGVAAIRRWGGAEREVRVNLDPARLVALGITVDDVNAQVRAVNANMPGGRSTLGTTEQSIRTLGSVETVEQLRNLTITLPASVSTTATAVAVRTARLGELGSIEDGFAEVRSAARFNGQPVVVFAVLRSAGESEVDVAKGVDRRIEALQKRVPGLKLDQIYSNAEEAEIAYRASREALLLGAALAALVVAIFLRDWRATAIVVIAMPLSIFPTFFPMLIWGFTLNWCSLLALTLVVGVLVDDAIVEIENIVRHIRMGKTPYQAALDAADEIGLAVVATTMTIVAVFLPVSFMPGIAGEYFRQFGATIAVAVLFSLLVARLITPMMAAYLATPEGPKEHTPRFIGRYLSLLGWALDHRVKTMLVAVCLFIGSLALLPFIPTEFLGAEDNSLSVMTIELPPGSTLADTEAATVKMSEIIRREPEVRNVLARMGGSYGDVRLGRILINLVKRADRTRRQQAIEKDLSEKLKAVPGVRFSFFGSNGGDQDLAISLVGDDPRAMEAVSDEMVRAMQQMKGLSNVKSSASLLRPELQIVPLYDRAAELGVSVAQISNTARLATLGEINANLAKFNLPDRQIPIRVQIDPRARADLDQIRNLRVSSAAGGSVPLDSVADVHFGSGTSQIKRRDRSRQITVGADLSGAPLGPAVAAVKALPVLQSLPAGVRLRDSGASQDMDEVFGAFGAAFGAGILLVLGVLVLLFQSFLQPITIMVALPLSLGGAFLALLVTGESISLTVLIGLMMLMGIVTKNSILLADYAMLAMKEHGLPRREALLEAGAKRAQPIIMTTLAMVGGMLPIAMRFGEQADFRAPMAITVIGGLIASTLLSLVFVPVAFTFIDDLQHWLGRRFVKILTVKPVTVAERQPAE